MKSLKDILYGVGLSAVNGSTDVLVNQVRFDSRKVGHDDVFVAIKGSLTDGHKYIEKAVGSGAKAIICEELPEQMANGVTYAQVNNGNSALAIMASNYFGNPSRNLKLVGVTGTNGKTTVSSLLYQLFKKAGYKVGLISTIKIMVDEKEYVTSHTTPDA
ncbi:MAG: Mur ligase domain-containing protein, partial [Flavobacteriaceae bacterium]